MGAGADGYGDLSPLESLRVRNIFVDHQRIHRFRIAVAADNLITVVSGDTRDRRLFAELCEIQITGSERLGDGRTVLEVIHRKGHVASLKFFLQISQIVSQI